MPFSKEDKALTTNLYQFKKYGSRRIVTEFSLINCKREELHGRFTEKIRETWSTDHRYESGRPKHVRTEENVTTVDELVSLLSQEGQKQTLRLTRQMSRETALIGCIRKFKSGCTGLTFNRHMRSFIVSGNFQNFYWHTHWKLAIKWSVTITPYLNSVATLPCEI